MKALQTKGLIRTFRDGTRETQVLKGIDLTINHGEFISITGASGTGKSTLVYHLGLLDEPTDGAVYVDGRNASEMSVSEKTAYRLRNFGFVFQDYALIPELNAWENVALPALMRGTSLKEARQQAEETLGRIGMAERVEHAPSQLSGGESQRVSIARAILHKPSVLFADEPTANLDTERSQQIIGIFETLHRSGQTIVMVTHEREYARRAERFIEMEDGVIASDTSPVKNRTTQRETQERRRQKKTQ